jgi:hypothetical protein
VVVVGERRKNLPANERLDYRLEGVEVTERDPYGGSCEDALHRPPFDPHFADNYVVFLV